MPGVLSRIFSPRPPFWALARLWLIAGVALPIPAWWLRTQDHLTATITNDTWAVSRDESGLIRFGTFDDGAPVAVFILTFTQDLTFERDEISGVTWKARRLVRGGGGNNAQGEELPAAEALALAAEVAATDDTVLMRRLAKYGRENDGKIRRRVFGLVAIGARANVVESDLRRGVDAARTAGFVIVPASLLLGCVQLTCRFKVSRRLTRARRGLCPACGYETGSLPGTICPECGTDTARAAAADREASGA